MPIIKSIAGFYASCQFQVGQEDISMPSGFPVLQFQKCRLQMFNLAHVEMNFFRMAGTLVSGKIQGLFAIGGNKKVGFL